MRGLVLAFGLSIFSTAVSADSRTTTDDTRDRYERTSKRASLASQAIDLFECAHLSHWLADGRKARRYFAIALDATKREIVRDPGSNVGLRMFHPEPSSEDFGSVVGGYRAALARRSAHRNASCGFALGVHKPICTGVEKRLDELGCERLAADLSR